MKKQKIQEVKRKSPNQLMTFLPSTSVPNVHTKLTALSPSRNMSKKNTKLFLYLNVKSVTTSPRKVTELDLMVTVAPNYVSDVESGTQVAIHAVSQMMLDA